jgi:F-type H+-transporting ATPase subunit a
MAAGHSPMEQFAVTKIIPIELAGYDISFTNASLWMVLAVAAASLFLVLGVKRDGIVPGRMQSIVEMIYDFVRQKTVLDAMGESGMKFFPFIFTFAMAITVFAIVIAIGLWTHGLHFFSLFVPSGAPAWIMPIIVPIEIISFLSRPISLSVRLAANMLAGHTMLKVFAGFIVTMLGAGGVLSFLAIAPLLAGIAVTALEVLVAGIQAWVFALLTCIYLNEAVHLHDH